MTLPCGPTNRRITSPPMMATMNMRRANPPSHAAIVDPIGLEVVEVGLIAATRS